MRKKFRGAIVTNVNDPEKRGRIKVKCAGVADLDSELPYWFEAEPLMSGGNGLLILPCIGDLVSIELTVSEDDDIISNQADPRWMRGDIGENVFPEEFINGYDDIGSNNHNTSFIVYSRKGHIIYFSDKDDEERIYLRTGSGRISIDMDQYEETLRMDAPKIILNANEVWIGDPDNPTSRIIGKIGKRVI